MFDKKLTLDSDLRNLEKLIFDLETKYLEETANTGCSSYLNWLNLGNILKGWEGYLTIKNPKAATHPTRKTKIGMSERLFSLSSLTSPAVRILSFNFKL